MESFSQRLLSAIDRVGAPTCVGIDPHRDLLPAYFRSAGQGLSGAERRAAEAAAVREWSLRAVEGMAPHVAAVKVQHAFFERLGAPGVAALEEVVAAAKDAGILVIADAKRGDIGSTAAAYAEALLDADGPVGADAATVSPYLGPESLDPFLAATARGSGIFVLVRTSNPGAGPWQVETGFAERVAAWITATNATHADASGFGPVGAVVAANRPDELAFWRERLARTWLLLPGYGAQGATAADLAPFLAGPRPGMLVTSSRAVLFGSPDEGDVRGGVAARALRFREEIRHKVQ